MFLLRLNHQLKEFSVLQGFEDANRVVKPGWSATSSELVTLTDCLNIEKHLANGERGASVISSMTLLIRKKKKNHQPQDCFEEWTETILVIFDY